MTDQQLDRFTHYPKDLIAVPHITLLLSTLQSAHCVSGGGSVCCVRLDVPGLITVIVSQCCVECSIMIGWVVVYALVFTNRVSHEEATDVDNARTNSTGLPPMVAHAIQSQSLQVALCLCRTDLRLVLGMGARD